MPVSIVVVGADGSADGVILRGGVVVLPSSRIFDSSGPERASRAASVGGATTLDKASNKRH